jgi:hypothetical protein
MDQMKLQIHERGIWMVIKSASHMKLLSCPEDVLHQNTFNTWHAVFVFCTTFLCQCSFNYFREQFLGLTWYYSETQRIEHGSQQADHFQKWQFCQHKLTSLPISYNLFTIIEVCCYWTSIEGPRMVCTRL